MQTDELYELTENLLNSKQQVKLIVGGNSMFPFLRNGDEIVINKCRINELNIGDIVVFKTHDKWIAHRLHKIKSENNKTILITKGDSCNSKDLPVTEENFAGKVILFFRKGKEKNINSNYYKKINRCIVSFSKPFTLFIIPLLWFITRYKKIILTIKNIKKTLFFICRESKRLTIVNIIISVLQGILPFVIIYLFKWMIDGMWKINGYADKTAFFNDILVIIIITGLVFLLSSVLNILNNEFRERLSQSVSVYIYNLLHQKHISLDMAYLEDAQQQDKIHRAVQEAGFRPLKMINESFTAIQSIISWAVIAAILFRIHWIIFVLILIAVIPGFWVRFKFSHKLYKLNKTNSTKERESYYYNRILTSLAFAKEIRLFGIGNFFTERFNNIQTNLHKQKNVLLRKRAIADIFAQIFAVTFIFFSFA
ncbi:MAG: signal peptidase I, partial [Bacteroidetes bacterium]|nr:signal peptidase I [Bacteroidota bacterium]